MMDDGKTLFHADHMNKAATGSMINESSVTEARTAMRLQKNINGTGTAGVTPAVLLVGPRMETTAEKFVASISATKYGGSKPVCREVASGSREPLRAWAGGSLQIHSSALHWSTVTCPVPKAHR